MEFLSNITLLIHEDRDGDLGSLKGILAPYRAQKTGSWYTVRGTFEELDLLVAKLSRRDERRTFQENRHSVSVSEVVMDYIQQKCAEKLQKISGECFVLDIQPDVQVGQSRSRSSVLVTFRPHRGSLNAADSSRLDFVMQRFITFYQRTLSDLQVTSFHLGLDRPGLDHLVPDHLSDLSRKFPRLLFRPGQSRKQVTVIGPFPYITKLREFLWDRSSRGTADKHRTGVPDGKPSPERGKANEEESCPICMEPIQTRETLQCRHSFCRGCLAQAFRHKPVCPICGQVYGVLKGVQPDGGTMEVSTKRSSHYPGYEKYGTIIIQYYIPGGIQTDDHPKPGSAIRRRIPDSLPAGLAGRPGGVLKLLRRAFLQKLVFTVGRSTTSGRNNTVTWNDVHHKTSIHGGPSHYGYPDPDYLSRVREELKAKGIE
ncbi:E3 ubiquitin-protein ligase DTX1 [Melanotaenia boesemani]|uniref:E3 ubiquitin-protein ligase DTX1 n=1 Tax=Melanotaenia boesemani TaxID=1250792 RepID=UPI001C03EA19|nr:E3 ubiquitin-protein ligase DTX1 [Melanotaenia boesemani]